MMHKIGMTREEAAVRMYETWASSKSQGHSQLLFKSAVYALCALGVGSRQMQAESVFRSCDKDGNGALSRGEVLAFVQSQNPHGTKASRKNKSEAFVGVGRLFELLGCQGKEEIKQGAWVDKVAFDDEIYQAFQNINPYRKFFLTKGQEWDSTDFSLQNVLNALYLHADAAESAAALADRVEALGNRIDADHSGYLDEKEILDALLALGYEQETAADLAQKECGGKGMPLRTFIQIFTEIAHANLPQFEAVEKQYGLQVRQAQLAHQLSSLTDQEPPSASPEAGVKQG